MRRAVHEPENLRADRSAHRALVERVLDGLVVAGKPRRAWSAFGKPRLGRPLGRREARHWKCFQRFAPRYKYLGHPQRDLRNDVFRHFLVPSSARENYKDPPYIGGFDEKRCLTRAATTRCVVPPPPRNGGGVDKSSLLFRRRSRTTDFLERPACGPANTGIGISKQFLQVRRGIRRLRAGLTQRPCGVLAYIRIYIIEHPNEGLHDPLCVRAGLTQCPCGLLAHIRIRITEHVDERRHDRPCITANVAQRARGSGTDMRVGVIQ